MFSALPFSISLVFFEIFVSGFHLYIEPFTQLQTKRRMMTFAHSCLSFIHAFHFCVDNDIASRVTECIYEHVKSTKMIPVDLLLQIRRLQIIWQNLFDCCLRAVRVLKSFQWKMKLFNSIFSNLFPNFILNTFFIL